MYSGQVKMNNRDSSSLIEVYQEDQKEELRPNQWKCNSCGKMFRSEHYIDLHMDRKHPPKATVSITFELLFLKFGRRVHLALLTFVTYLDVRMIQFKRHG